MKYIEIIILTILSIIACVLTFAFFAMFWHYDWVRFFGIWGSFCMVGILFTLWITNK